MVDRDVERSIGELMLEMSAIYQGLARSPTERSPSAREMSWSDLAQGCCEEVVVAALIGSRTVLTVLGLGWSAPK